MFPNAPMTEVDAQEAIAVRGKRGEADDRMSCVSMPTLRRTDSA